MSQPGHNHVVHVAVVLEEGKLARDTGKLLGQADSRQAGRASCPVRRTSRALDVDVDVEQQHHIRHERRLLPDMISMASWLRKKKWIQRTRDALLIGLIRIAHSRRMPCIGGCVAGWRGRQSGGDIGGVDWALTVGHRYRIANGISNSEVLGEEGA